MKETVIIGGGLAGAAAATSLARQGLPVRLFERETQPTDKVCGEFLSIESQRHLKSLGLDLDRLGASAIDRLRLVSGRRTIEATLPFTARGLTRRRLDSALLDLAAAAGARIERGVAVRSIGDGGIDTGCGVVSPETLVIASGKHEVRGAPRATAGCETGFVGFKTHYRLPPRARADLAGKVDVILFPGGYAGVQLVEGDMANLCLLVTKRRLGELGGRWAGVRDALLREPHAAALLGEAEPLAAKPLTIAGVPYGFLHRGEAHGRTFRLGDQAAVIPSFCGEGMAIALHSAAVASSVIGHGGSAADHHAVLRRDFGSRLRVAMALQRAGTGAWSRSVLWHALSLSPRSVSRLVDLTRVRGSAGRSA